tara:strand:- start:891 stop:1517 length:627 start_codon:yes stop_codon:yes gene_type:complete
MSGYVSYTENYLFDNVKKHTVPIIKATPENFKNYGYFVHNYFSEKVIIKQWPHTGWRKVADGTGYGGGTVEGNFSYTLDGKYMKATNDAVGGYYIIGILNENSILTREANYHPDGGQIFFPFKSGPFILLLALPGDNIKMDDFVGFYFKGSVGVQIFPGVWHQPAFPINGEATFVTKQGAVHACVVVDTVNEFNSWLEIPLGTVKNNS